MDKEVFVETFVVFSQKDPLELLRKDSKTEALGDILNRKRRKFSAVVRIYTASSNH
jgi:hypothetical protein